MALTALRLRRWRKMEGHHHIAPHFDPTTSGVSCADALLVLNLVLCNQGCMQMSQSSTPQIHFASNARWDTSNDATAEGGVSPWTLRFIGETAEVRGRRFAQTSGYHDGPVSTEGSVETGSV
jgi:hypothetical protein